MAQPVVPDRQALQTSHLDMTCSGFGHDRLMASLGKAGQAAPGHMIIEKNPAMADGEICVRLYREINKMCTKVAMNGLETIRSWSTSDR